MAAKKALVVGAVALLTVVGLGYLTAWLSVAGCSDLTRARLVAHPRIGYGIGPEQIKVGPEAVQGYVVGPFQVETVFSVPKGLHSSLHYQTFWAQPWRCQPRSIREVHL